MRDQLNGLDIPEAVKGRSLWQDALRRLLHNKAAVASMILLGIIVLLAIFAPFLSSWAFDEPDWGYDFPGAPNAELHHWFGTDGNGRDLFVRTLYGARISLMVGIIATTVSLLIGVTYGATAGFLGGRVDNVMMRIVDIMYSLPFMFFVILLMVAFERNFLLIFVAIGAVNWLDMARIVRGQTLSLREREFVEAARLTGVSTWQIIRRHIAPNLIGVVVVYVTLTIPQAILVESFLSFLGLGIQEPRTSLGSLVNGGVNHLETASWMLLIPGGLLALILLCFNFLGDAILDRRPLAISEAG